MPFTYTKMQMIEGEGMGFAQNEGVHFVDPLIYAAMACCASVLVVYLFSIMFVVGPARKSVFTDEFMSQFEGVAKAAGKPIPKTGNPDSGSGMFSQKLAYKDWLKFNASQRIQMNQLESQPLNIIAYMCVSIWFPTIGVVIFSI
mmetsp:Transcript_57520/g.79011  ORF Transcript_57520/g.79011 Transcript_57520/m.79011 type:complete len:144 (-) Transcript_57520:288-719(-)